MAEATEEEGLESPALPAGHGRARLNGQRGIRSTVSHIVIWTLKVRQALAMCSRQEIHNETWRVESNKESDMDERQERKSETRLAMQKEPGERVKRTTKAIKNMRKQKAERLKTGAGKSGSEGGNMQVKEAG